MKKRLVFLTVVALILVLFVSAALADVTMYVYTKNGKPVHVRSSMSTKNRSNIKGSFPYGAAVTVYDPNFNGWAMVDFGDGEECGGVVRDAVVFLVHRELLLSAFRFVKRLHKPGEIRLQLFHVYALIRHL